MRLAVFGDVHSNRSVLEAVLEDIRQAAPDTVDTVLNLGDSVWGAADPAGAWALQAERAPVTARGNTDERVAGRRAGKETLRSRLLARLPADVPATLAALPTFLDTADEEVRAAHGSPWEDLMLTEEGEHTRPAHFRELREGLGSFTYDTSGRGCIVGHTHREMLSVVDSVTAVNAGPVSRQKDGLPLARWVLLTRRGGASEFRRRLGTDARSGGDGRPRGALAAGRT